jgi:hypothetical protein
MKAISKQSVFVPDDEYPQLPKYSEWGYNTFGAFYDRMVFVSSDTQIPVKIINNENKTAFHFNGRLGSYYSGNNFSMTLTIDNFNPQSYTELLDLDNTVLDLKDSKYAISVGRDGVESPVQILKGEFAIKRAQNLFVDNKHQQIIISGEFHFQAIVNGEPINVSDGRFDLGVSDDNFFSY